MKTITVMKQFLTLKTICISTFIAQNKRTKRRYQFLIRLKRITKRFQLEFRKIQHNPGEIVLYLLTDNIKFLSVLISSIFVIIGGN